MVKTWYLQRSQKPSCSWYGRLCRTLLLSFWRSLPWSPLASLSTTLPESREEENVSGAAVTSFMVSPLKLRTAKDCSCTGLLTSLPLTSLALADTLTPTCTYTLLLIGVAGHTWFWPATRDQATHGSCYFVFTSVCEHIIRTLNVCVVKVLERLAKWWVEKKPWALSTHTSALWAVKQEMKTKTITMCWVSSINHAPRIITVMEFRYSAKGSTYHYK